MHRPRRAYYTPRRKKLKKKKSLLSLFLSSLSTLRRGQRTNKVTEAEGTKSHPLQSHGRVGRGRTAVAAWVGREQPHSVPACPALPWPAVGAHRIPPDLSITQSKNREKKYSEKAAREGGRDGGNRMENGKAGEGRKRTGEGGRDDGEKGGKVNKNKNASRTVKISLTDDENKQ